jgi:type IV fimbrial biogenesis protein FimT
MRTRALRALRGFTLIELLVVLTILGIMMGIGIPSFKNFIGTQRAKSAAYELVTSLLLARSEAVKRNADVTITPSTANTWTSGWSVVSGSTTLQTQGTLDNITFTSPTSTASVTFKGTGRPSASAKWEIASSTTTRCVKLDSAGVPSTSAGACP